MMKRRNVVIGVILASVLIVAIVIQATFGAGVGGGVAIDPHEASVNQGSTFTYAIILRSVESDCFDLRIIPRTNSSWFEWLDERVCVGQRSEETIYLNVTPTESGTFWFTVRAESGSTRASDTAKLYSKPPPSPTPTPTPTAAPTCLCLMPDLPSPQKIMIWYEIINITWTAFAYPDSDTIQYRFCVIGPGTNGEECSEWSTSNKWIWQADAANEGVSSIYADVKDGDDYGESCESTYQITLSKEPECACLLPGPEQFSPMPFGPSIKWTACASDPDGEQDELSYRFWLKGPETENVWKQTRKWDTKNTWTWDTSTLGDYLGDYDIRVWVRDNYETISPFYAEATFEDYEIY